ncbi:MAG: ABC transporter permease, partial [Neisseria elongata]
MANKQKLSWFLKAMLFLGLAFLYIPLIVLVVYSFNDSKLVTIWGGFSTKWYAKLLNNDQILEAAWLSLRIAVVSSLAATVLGTLAGYALARIKRFRGSTLFAGMVSAPMVMPDVITGLSMLLLIIQVQTMLQGIFGNTSSFGNGFFTIFLGHATLCMAYITVVIRARLAELDQSLEEAAMDLGARPLKIFFVITLPLIMPAIVSGFLLGVTLSLDDLVITSFLSGPGSSTLPQVIFSKIKLGLDPQMNVLATIIIAIVGTLVIIMNWYMMRQTTRREREAAEAERQERLAMEQAIPNQTIRTRQKEQHHEMDRHPTHR